MKSNTNQIQWGKFAGLASQWAVALTLLIFLGKYIDQKTGRFMGSVLVYFDDRAKVSKIL